MSPALVSMARRSRLFSPQCAIGGGTAPMAPRAREVCWERLSIPPLAETWRTSPSFYFQECSSPYGSHASTAFWSSAVMAFIIPAVINLPAP